MENLDLFAFVLMPFSSDFDDIYRIGIKETAIDMGIKAERVDEQLYSEEIIQRIYRQIDLADIVIADMTGQNANVFYEVGYAHAKDKITILLTKNVEDIPFDLRNRRHVVYGNSIQNLRDELKNELQWASTQIDNERKSRVKVSVKSITADLELTKWSATGFVEFKIDLHNDSCVPSSSIDSIYFYSGKGWDLKQSSEECPITYSDIDGFKYRHYLRPPVSKLQAKSWAQLNFKASRTLAFATLGEELKDKYSITGKAMLRFIGDKGIFDHDIEVNVTADTCPF